MGVPHDKRYNKVSQYTYARCGQWMRANMPRMYYQFKAEVYASLGLVPKNGLFVHNPPNPHRPLIIPTHCKHTVRIAIRCLAENCRRANNPAGERLCNEALAELFPENEVATPTADRG